MRLFYIIFFLAITINFAALASKVKRNDAPVKKFKISFVTDKKITKGNSGFSTDNGHLQKDFINSFTFKISSAAFILLSFLAFLAFKNKNVGTKVIIKRLTYNYWCHFKMLYPKHVFW